MAFPSQWWLSELNLSHRSENSGGLVTLVFAIIAMRKMFDALVNLTTKNVKDLYQ